MPNAKRTLNDRSLKSLKPAPAGKTYDLMDTVVPGFGVRVAESGRKTFVLVARYGGSKNPTRRAMGTYGALTLEAARKKARHWIELIEAGKDPAVEAERQKLTEIKKLENTFAAVAKDFIREKLPSERQGHVVERDLRRVFIPAWGKRSITDITPLDVMAIIKKFKAAGKPAQAYNLLGYARRVFAWAIDQLVYDLTASPCDRLRPKSVIGKRNIGKRTLSDEELKALWLATEKLGYPYGPLFRLLALTGQRKSEVAEARWSEFNLAKKLWVIPTERMKSDAVHEVPLSDDAVKVLESLPRFQNGDYLFSTKYGKKPVNSFNKAKLALDAAMLAELKELPPFVIHDIRRTMRTGLSAIPSISDLVRELVIAHTKPGLHRVYDQHSYEAEKRHALDAWAGRLRDIVQPPPANVVRLAHA